MMRKRGAAAALTFACAGLMMIAAPGCGEGGPSLVNVTGTVTQNNKPLEGAAVRFLPDSAGAQPAEDVTGASGNFKLRTGGRFGAAPGKYHVVITPAPPAAATAKADPAFADDPFMANLSIHGDQTGPPRKGKAAPAPTEHTEDREVTTEANQVQDFDVKLKAAG